MQCIDDAIMIYFTHIDDIEMKVEEQTTDQI